MHTDGVKRVKPVNDYEREMTFRPWSTIPRCKVLYSHSEGKMDLVTHYITAKRFLASHPELDESFARAFIFGAEGPDPFFFMGKQGYALASAIHKSDPRSLFDPLPELFGTEARRGYALGVMLHYFGDRGIHPYIGWLSEKDGRACAHVEYESAIEVEAYRREFGSELRNFDYKGTYRRSCEVINAAYSFWRARLGEEITVTYIETAFRRMRRLTTLFMHASKGACLMARLLDRLSGIPGGVMAHMKTDRGSSAMNDARSPWIGPDGESTASVGDIMDEAVAAFSNEYDRLMLNPGGARFSHTEPFSYGS